MRTTESTLSYDDVSLKFIGGPDCLVDGMAANKNLGLEVTLGVEIADLLNVWIQIITESKPDGNRLFLQDGLDARVLRDLGHITNPADEADTDGDGRISRKFQRFTSRTKVVSQFGGGIKS